MNEIGDVVRKELTRMLPELAVMIADECVVRPGQVKLLLGCQETLANQIRKLEDFPRMHEVSPGVFGYMKSEIIAWLRSREVTESPVVKGRVA